MPIGHRFDSASRVLFVRLSGVVTDDDLIGYAETITTDPTLAPVHHELIDLREVGTAAASTATLRQVADVFRKRERAPGEVRIAFVATSDAAYGLARMYQAFRADSAAEMRVFRNAEDARRWLGIDEG